MGFMSKLSLNKRYKKLDEKLHGVLPGGVKRKKKSTTKKTKSKTPSQSISINKAIFGNVKKSIIKAPREKKRYVSTRGTITKAPNPVKTGGYGFLSTHIKQRLTPFDKGRCLAETREALKQEANILRTKKIITFKKLCIILFCMQTNKYLNKHKKILIIRVWQLQLLSL